MPKVLRHIKWKCGRVGRMHWNALVLKTRVPVKVPGVRIPPLPQLNCKWMPCASSTTRGNAYIEKEVPTAYKGNGIEVCSTPTVLTVKWFIFLYMNHNYGRNKESKYGGHSWRGLRESRLIVCVLWKLIFLRKIISLTLWIGRPFWNRNKRKCT